MEISSSKRIDEIAFHLIMSCLLTIGATPIEDSFEIRDFGPHRIYRIEGQFDVSDGRQIDPNSILLKLSDYLQQRNKVFHIPHFDIFETKTCGCLQQGSGKIILIMAIAIVHTA